jgi:hypothetical protein
MPGQVGNVGDPVGQVVDHLRHRAHETATAVKIVLFVVSHWWQILIVLAVLALWPRRRRSS